MSTTVVQFFENYLLKEVFLFIVEFPLCGLYNIIRFLDQEGISKPIILL